MKRFLCPVLIGRNDELGELRAALGGAAERDEGATVFLVGEAGVGKTRLAREAVAEARDVHFKVSHESARPLTTQIYFAGDPWLDSDVVVGAVKDALVTAVVWGADDSGRPRATCSYDFVLGPAA